MNRKGSGKRWSGASVLSAIGVAFLLALAPAGAGAAETIKFNMSWLPQGSIIGFASAVERGLYKRQGLDVKLFRGYGGMRTVNEVASAQFQFGFGAPQGVIFNRTKGGRTKLVGTIYDDFPNAVCWNKKKFTINKPSDFVGKKVGGSPFSPIQVMFPLLLRSQGVDPAKVKLIKMKPSVIVSSFLSAKIDVTDCWLGSTASLLKILSKKKGIDLGLLPFKSYGMDVYGNGIVANEAFIQSKPDATRKFVRTSYQGYSWASKNVDAAVDLLLKRFPALKRPIVRQQWTDVNPMMKGPDFAKKGYGWMDRK
ncbi:MAG: ABC transporter substrate-binding protein, partial [Nitrospinota bacterium]